MTGMRIDEILDELKSLANPIAAQGMARYGINPLILPS